jgi:type III pantothenate kinase
MLLAIDAGNTNIVFAFVDGTRIEAQFRASTKDARTPDEYYVWLAQLMALHNLKAQDIDGAIIATVVPQTLFNLRMLCRRFFMVEPLVVGEANCNLGLAVKTLRPDAVGADRIVNAVAAHADFPDDNLIVIDFGTATTFDVVASNGDYEGGVIAPGVNLSLEALHQAAAKLPRIAIERPQSVIGNDTIPAMQSGVFWGYVSMIEGMVTRIRSEYGHPMKVVATGGLASLFRNTVGLFELTDADLTIRGLALIFQRNPQARNAKPLK